MEIKVSKQHYTAVPYLAIFDGSGKPIIDPLYKKPIGMFMTSFTFSYVDEGSDEGNFVLETDNVNLCTHPSLRYLMPLQLQWGWKTETGKTIVGPARLTTVKEHKISFTPTGIKFTIEFIDASEITKTTSAVYKGANKDFFEYIKGILQGQSVPFQILDYSSREAYEPKVANRINQI